MYFSLFVGPSMPSIVTIIISILFQLLCTDEYCYMVNGKSENIVDAGVVGNDTEILDGLLARRVMRVQLLQAVAEDMVVTLAVSPLRDCWVSWAVADGDTFILLFIMMSIPQLLVTLALVMGVLVTSLYVAFILNIND